MDKRSPLPSDADTRAAQAKGEKLAEQFDTATAKDPADLARRYGDAPTDSPVVFVRNVTKQPLCEWLHGTPNVIGPGRVGQVFKDRVAALGQSVEAAAAADFAAQEKADKAPPAPRKK